MEEMERNAGHRLPYNSIKARSLRVVLELIDEFRPRILTLLEQVEPQQEQGQ